LIGDGREERGLIALLCGRSDLNIGSGEYIAAAPLRGEAEREKKPRKANSLQWMFIISSNPRRRYCNRVDEREI
jgi:hypothetical protein